MFRENSTETLSFDSTDAAAPSGVAVAAPSPAVVGLEKTKERLEQAAKTLTVAAPHASIDDLNAVQAQLDALESVVQDGKLAFFMASMKQRIGALRDPAAPDLGQAFLAAMERVGCKTRIDDKLQSAAAYTSYSYAPHNRGFANEVKLNPRRAADVDKFTDSTAHEFVHAFQKSVSPALQCSPFNPDTRVIIHPADWIMLETLCERDAYTKQVLINSLLAQENPEIRDRSEFDVISVPQFEAIRANAPSLEDALVTSALTSLSKPVRRSDPGGRTFLNHYQDVALNNFSAGMAMRQKEGEKDLVFVRVEMRDLWQLGNYGVGPNSFGENVIEPLFGHRHDLPPEAKGKLERLCKQYKIPPLDQCPTLSDYLESVQMAASVPAQAQTNAAPVQRQALQIS